MPKIKSVKNIAILVASIIFYSWGGPKFIFVILGVTLLDFILVRAMSNSDSERKRKMFLFVSLAMNLGLLFYFKYFNFFIDNLNGVTHLFGASSIQVAKILLPIGISFYTFESITYVVDVYRRVHKPLDNFWDYQLYILFFPKLIAGPIVRYHDISDQITNHVSYENANNRLHGFVQFCIGLAKKVLIANIVGSQAEAIFAMKVGDINTVAAWIGALAYTFQIYFDFSGYSDMAIGLGRIMGFSLPENFRNPYTATSISDFWRKWHITLGAWMRNYLYIPLGGNQVSTAKLYRNLAIVFIASGLWHGASWNFVLWGAYHGLFLILDRIFLQKVLDKIGRIPAMIFTFIVVVVGWMLFRLEDLNHAFAYIKTMFAFNFNPDQGIIVNNDFQYIVFVAAFFSFFAIPQKAKDFQHRIFHAGMGQTQLMIFTAISLVLFFISLTFVSASSFNPFIYFKF